MKAYKGFNSDLTCRGYQFSRNEVNRTSEANCKRNGFHCAENPLDCLRYYPDYKTSVYYIVEASGDINETDGDSKISCTELRLIKKLSFMGLLLEGAAYMVRYPDRKWSSTVITDRGCACGGYAVVRGKEPTACGDMGDTLILVRERTDRNDIRDIGVYVIDGEKYFPNIWYGIEGRNAEGSVA